MKFYEFSLFLAEKREVTEQLANQLFNAGCDDATLTSCNGAVEIYFTRESTSLEAAIQSAIADVSSIGVKVLRAEIQADLMASTV